MEIKKRFVESGIVVTEYFVTASDAAEVADKIGLDKSSIENLKLFIESSDVTLVDNGIYYLVVNGKRIDAVSILENGASNGGICPPSEIESEPITDTEDKYTTDSKKNKK